MIQVELSKDMVWWWKNNIWVTSRSQTHHMHQFFTFCMLMHKFIRWICFKHVQTYMVNLDCSCGSFSLGHPICKWSENVAWVLNNPTIPWLGDSLHPSHDSEQRSLGNCRGSFLVKKSALGSDVCFKLSAVAVLVDRLLVKAPCSLWTW